MQSRVINTERILQVPSGRRFNTVRTCDAKLDPMILYCSHLPSTVYADDVQSSYSSSSTSASGAVRKACLCRHHAALSGTPTLTTQQMRGAAGEIQSAAPAMPCPIANSAI